MILYRLYPIGRKMWRMMHNNGKSVRNIPWLERHRIDGDITFKSRLHAKQCLGEHGLQVTKEPDKNGVYRVYAGNPIE